MFLGLDLLCKTQEAEENFDRNRERNATNVCTAVDFSFRLKLRVDVRVKDRTRHEEGLDILNRHHSEAGWTSRQPADVSGAR